MKQSRRKFSKECKLTALRRIEAGESVNEVARALEMDPSDVRRWRRELSRHGERAFGGRGQKRGQPSREAELERKIGQQAGEIDFFKASLAACRRTGPAAGSAWRRNVYEQIEKEVSGGTKLTVQRMCALAQLSRARFYRPGSASQPAERERELRRQIRQLALQGCSYGSRRIREELQRRGWRVNRKRVQRQLREQNLLCRRKRKFVVTTDSQHGLAVYPNLAPTLALDGVNQLWVADLTYIRLNEEFVYRAVLLDAYSRRVIGWRLGTGLDQSLPLAALRMALAKWRPRPGLVHHSDRGAQYASQAYTQWLAQHQMRISMSRKANPYDNPRCESFFQNAQG